MGVMLGVCKGVLWLIWNDCGVVSSVCNNWGCTFNFFLSPNVGDTFNFFPSQNVRDAYNFFPSPFVRGD